MVQPEHKQIIPCFLTCFVKARTQTPQCNELLRWGMLQPRRSLKSSLLCPVLSLSCCRMWSCFFRFSLPSLSVMSKREKRCYCLAFCFF